MIVAADLGQAQDWMDVYPVVKDPFVVAAPKGLIKAKWLRVRAIA
jgi:hypothetical protein